jgi:hypothetical protein
MEHLLPKKEIHKKFTKELNDIFKHSPEDEKHQGLKKLKDFCDKYAPKSSRGNVEFGLPIEKEIPDNTIVLLVHAYRKIRCLGSVSLNVDCTNEIPTKYRYVIKKLIKKENDSQNKMFPHLKNIMIVPDKQKQQRLISKKKGFWIFWLPSFNAKITTTNLAQNMTKVLSWHDKYVDGMQKNPSPAFPLENEFFGEQFLLDKYPTEEWKQHFKTYQKRNNKKKLLSLKKNDDSSDDDDDDDDNDENTPPPPPPLLPPPPPPPYPPPSVMMSFSPMKKKNKTSSYNDMLENLPVCPEEGKEFINLDDVDVLNLFNIELFEGKGSTAQSNL